MTLVKVAGKVGWQAVALAGLLPQLVAAFATQRAFAVPRAASFPRLEVAFGALLQHHKARLHPAKVVRE